MPALATTTSMPPKCSTALAAAACMAGRSRTSAANGQDVLVAAELGCERVERGCVEVGQHQLGAQGAQPLGDLSTDPPGATCNEDDFVLQRCHVLTTYPCAGRCRQLPKVARFRMMPANQDRRGSPWALESNGLVS